MSEYEDVPKIIVYLEQIGATIRTIKGRDYTISDLARIRSKEGEFGQGYDFKLILVDVCLAWRRKYNTPVIPRIKDISRRYSEVKTLEELKGLIEKLGDSFNKEFWNFDSDMRKDMLYSLTCELLEYKKKHKIDGDLEAMKAWARRADIKNHNKGINGRPIKGLGIANFQYLRMLCGVDTVKPDGHIIKGMETAVNHSVKPYEAVKLLEAVSLKIKKSMLELDQLLWVYFAVEIPDIGWKP